MYVANNWEALFRSARGIKHTVYPTNDPYEAEVVVRQEATDEGDGGTYGEVYLVFKVTDNDGKDRFFKKTGYETSYGDDERVWDGEVVEVFRRQLRLQRNCCSAQPPAQLVGRDRLDQHGIRAGR